MIDGTKILITNNRERITIALDSAGNTTIATIEEPIAFVAAL